MNVVYDLLGFQSRDHGERGIARYVLNLALALERTHPELETTYLVHPDRPFPTGLEQLVRTGRVQMADSRATGSPSSDGGVFIAGSPFEYYNHPSSLILPEFARSNEWRRLVVLHDLIPAIFPELYLTERQNQHWYSARLAALGLFDHYLANSDATANDAIQMLDLAPERVTVIGAGADDQFRRPAEGHASAARSLVESGLIPGLRTGFILFPTGIDPRKNIERAIHAYGRLPKRTRERHQMVLACRLSDGDREAVTAMADAAGLGPELLVTGYITDPTLCRLYQAAHLVLFPSYYEGFGLPALEAMRCGAPVICADATSLIEVQPIEEARFDPMSVRAISAALIRALNDDHFRQELREQSPPPFTWDRAGELTGDIVASELAGLRQRIVANGNRRAKPRLAVFGPLPPQETGAARYTYRLVEQLSRHADVTVFVDRGPGDRDRPVRAGDGSDLGTADVVHPDGVTVEPTDHYEPLAAAGAAFDQTLYLIGNSRHHIQALQAAKTRPGHVLMLDVRLTALYEAIQNQLPDRLVDRSVGRTLAEMYPERYRAEVEAMDVIGSETAHRFGILMARGFADDEAELLVHSDYARTLLRLDSAGQATVPIAMPCPTFDRPWSPADGNPIITAFGPLDIGRQPERLIAALPTILEGLPGARLRFAGRIDVERKHQLMDLADRLDVGESLEFHGERTDEQFRELQRQTWLAVQLRSRTDGGSSETLTELLALGVPTMISDFGPDAELPADAVALLDQNVDGDELGTAVVEMINDESGRRRMSLAARQYAGANSFAAAADAIAKLLFETPVRRTELDLTGDVARLVQAQQQTANEIEVVKGATSAYLGDHLLVTRLRTGQDIYVDGRDTSVAPALLLDGQWEPETTSVFRSLLQPSDCVIDVGANFGYFGLLAGQVVNREAGGSVHMIEANHELVSLIERSVTANRFDDRATVSNYAISDRPGQLELQIPEHLWGSSGLNGFDDELTNAARASLDGGLQVERRLTVPAIDLDQFTEERGIDRVTLIKMDIEGHEELAYCGMGDVVARNRGRLRILLEFSTGQYQDPEGFLDRLVQDLGSVAAIQPGSGQLIPVGGLGDVLALSDSGFVMLLAGAMPGGRVRPARRRELQRSAAS